MSENIIFCLRFHNKFRQVQHWLVFRQFIFMKWNGYKGLWVIEGRRGYIPCILQIQLNEGREMKAVFQGSFRLRWPSATLDDMAAGKCSLCRMEPSFWKTPLVSVSPLITWVSSPVSCQLFSFAYAPKFLSVQCVCRVLNIHLRCL